MKVNSVSHYFILVPEGYGELYRISSDGLNITGSNESGLFTNEDWMSI